MSKEFVSQMSQSIDAGVRPEGNLVAPAHESSKCPSSNARWHLTGMAGASWRARVCQLRESSRKLLASKLQLATTLADITKRTSHHVLMMYYAKTNEADHVSLYLFTNSRAFHSYMTSVRE